MYIVNQRRVEGYLEIDVVSQWLDTYSESGDDRLVCHQWLRNTAAKRYIFQELYGGLMNSQQSMSVLDVGGGLTGVTRELATRHRYTLVDILAHDNALVAQRIQNQVGTNFIKPHDWAELEMESYDLILANDIFPNVDQRLETFLSRFLPCTKRMTLSLTYYDTPRSYMTRRIDADEILCMLAWNSEYLMLVLKKYADQIVDANFGVFAHPNISVYPNGRQVCVVDFVGGVEGKSEP